MEGTFPTGTYLVTVHQPISTDDGDLERALYGSLLPVPRKDRFELPVQKDNECARVPGKVVVQKGRVRINEERKRRRLKVTSKGDRPIQVSENHEKNGKVLTVDWIGGIALPFYRNKPSIGV